MSGWIIAFGPALFMTGFFIFVAVMFRRLVNAAEGAQKALRDLADRFPNMGGS